MASCDEGGRKGISAEVRTINQVKDDMTCGGNRERRVLTRVVGAHPRADEKGGQGSPKGGRNRGRVSFQGGLAAIKRLTAVAAVRARFFQPFRHAGGTRWRRRRGGPMRPAAVAAGGRCPAWLADQTSSVRRSGGSSARGPSAADAKQIGHAASGGRSRVRRRERGPGLEIRAGGVAAAGAGG